jgi:hypothetical protein
MAENFREMGYRDSTMTPPERTSFPRTTSRCVSIEYEYDFGDGWRHEVAFEGRPTAEPGRRYPLCLEGEGTCPPEDVGGVWGYAEYLQAHRRPEARSARGHAPVASDRLRPRSSTPTKRPRQCGGGCRIGGSTNDE